MKHLSYTALLASSLALVSCASFNQPYEPSGGYNPLDPAGSTTTVASSSTPDTSAQNDYKPGTFLSATTPQTVFYNSFPSGSDQPSKVIPLYTEVKVISTKGSYTKAEIIDTGEVGFIPSIMLGEKRSPNEIAVIPGGGFTAPPLPDSAAPDEPMPSLLPEGVDDSLPPITPPLPDPSLSQDIPFVAPEPENKGIAPPETINPLLPNPLPSNPLLPE